jgi:hypothetical protein
MFDLIMIANFACLIILIWFFNIAGSFLIIFYLIYFFSRYKVFICLLLEVGSFFNFIPFYSTISCIRMLIFVFRSQIDYIFLSFF